MSGSGQQRRRWRRRLAVSALVLLVLAGGAAAAVAIAGPFFWYPCSLDGLQAHGQGRASILYAADGSRLGVLGAGRDRLPVSYRQISPLMRAAIVAAEDRRFYQNNGIDYLAVLRAVKADISSAQVSEGGSTITQQLVRNLYLSPAQTLSRKLTEGCLAVQLDQRWSKQRILTTYLNSVYFGHRAYGVEAAARAFFGVHASQLSLDQAALLAGMPQSPSGYDPFSRPGVALQRRAQVLQAMHDTGAISTLRYRQALHAPLGLHPGGGGTARSEPYLADYITGELVNRYGAERVRRGGLRVYTTLDARMQAEATRAITRTLNRKNDPAGALVSIDPATGAIRAMAIAQRGRRLAFDIAADGQRQAGSTFKTFVLTEAVRRGINPWTTDYLSAPFTGPGNWRVQTYEHTYSGRIPLSQATLASDNTVYARLTLDLDPRPIAALAHAMGIQSPLRPTPSLGLGVNPVSPLELTSAYATLADQGTSHTPTILRKVVFPDGRQDESRTSSAGHAVDPKVAAAVTRVLVGNVNAGTGTAAALAGRPAAGKTGTTDNYADAWFAGYTPQLATTVWVGYPAREQPMRHVHGIQVVGGSLPAQIWHTYMTAALRGLPVAQFPNPGPPPFHRWCGRYQDALTAADAKPHDGCANSPRHPATATTGTA
ncbi:MAG TPA: transglycosylase domain-containing protein, partial [Solirubrobacteraceae bacterium]|nr:transglycosylase domain-containing protein [Solirubrobacteraceae bacterium]